MRFGTREELRDRLEEYLPLLHGALAELGAVEPVTSSYDGSLVSYVLAARADLQPRQILSQLESPRSHKASPPKVHDKVLNADHLYVYRKSVGGERRVLFQRF